MISLFKSLELRHWVNLWVFFFSVTVLSAAGHGGQAAIVLLLTGLYVMFAKKSKADNAPLNSQEKAFIGLVLVFWLIQLFGAFYQPSGYEYETLREKFKALDYPMRWLLLIPVFLLFRRFLLDWRLVAIGLSIGAIIASSIAHYQVFFLGIDRAWGMSSHQISYAELMVVVDVLLWSLFIHAWSLRQKLLSFFLLLSSLVAFYGSLLSVSRGAWLVYIVLAAGWLLSKSFQGFSGISSLFKPANILRIGFSVFIFWAVANTHQYQLIQERTYATMDRYANGGASHAIGDRYVIVKDSLETFKRNVFGIGTDNFRAIDVESPYKGDQGYRYNHAHNEALNVLVENGIQGLISFVGLAFFSLYVFFSKLSCDNELVRVYAQLGLLLILSYAVFSLTQSVFSHHDTLIFFVFFLYLFMGQMHLLERGKALMTKKNK